MKNLVWAVGALIAIIVAVFLFSSSDSGGSDTIIPTPKPVVSASPNIMGITQDKNSNLPFSVLKQSEVDGKKVRIETGKGNIVIELFGDSPLAASNFIHLINKDFYNGLTFHRREEGFVIQGGDPNGDGTGGPGYKFHDEEVTRDYIKGTVAMANAGPDTNGSQFFIMLDDVLQLPKQYTIFGRVISGIDVVDKIAVGDVMEKATVLE